MNEEFEIKEQSSSEDKQPADKKVQEAKKDSKN